MIRCFCIGLLAVTAFIPLPAGHYLASDSLDLTKILPPPPAPGSIIEQEEIKVVLELQTKRTPEQAKRCREIEHETIFLFGAEALGAWFTADNLPQTAALFAEVREDFIPVNRAAKAIWPRHRPPFVDPRIQACVEVSDSGSYPSGHGIQSALWAGLLREIFPEQTHAIQQRAAETNRYKLLSGVHYPSDLEAGHRLGIALVQAMLKSPALQRTLVEVRAEMAALRKKSGFTGDNP